MRVKAKNVKSFYFFPLFFLLEKGKDLLTIPTTAQAVFDVTGAGDTVIASLSAFYGIGLPLKKILELANISAGIVVGKVGTKPVYWEEVKEFIKENSKQGVKNG